jgi:hypothetical protein
MSGRGNCYDNSMLETFFRTIKSELIWPVACQSRQQAENAVARFIEGFEIPIRRHSPLDFQSPIPFERTAQEVNYTLSMKAGQVHPFIALLSWCRRESHVPHLAQHAQP